MAYHIVRIDKDNSKTGGNTHGWQVRIGHDTHTSYHSKLFSDGKYEGDKEKSLAAAKTYLAEYLEKYPAYGVSRKYELIRHGFRADRKPIATNKSGRNGVFRSREFYRHDKSRYRYFWGASYTIDRFGKTQVIRNEKFYIDEHGETEAKRLAIEFREMWEEAAEQGVEAVKEFFAAYKEDRL
jgi:hypothetical protein